MALREILEPFGDIDGEGTNDYDGSNTATVTIGRHISYELTLADFRRARQALSDTPNPPKGKLE